MHLASKGGHRDIVKLLLENAADTNSALDGISPLRLAAQYGHDEVVSCLLQHGADVNMPHKGGLSPLAVAAINGYPAITRQLMEAGSNANGKDFAGATPLFHAVKNGQKDVCGILLEHGADTNILTNAKECALSMAALYGYLPIVDILLQGGADVLGVGCIESPVTSAVKRQHIQIVQKLIQAGASLDLSDDTHFDAVRPLIETLRMRKLNMDLLRVILQGGTNVDTPCLFNISPLEYAILNEHKEGVTMLLEADCNPKLLYSDARDHVGITNIIKNAVRMPRTLRRICRREIRKFLGYGLNYQRKVQHLEIPFVLKEFLIFQDL